ncbi:Ig-like domain-containing protein [Bathymodiolus japonicus methanotrophic gill symbiont]|uniref:Ig-like domain-containing protein n=1 Tax=Bathymodiolus japonicus methanotrophic gill symbiont TaxID=113269 RepID=UPI001E3C4754|nr:Ig-like domain-containing protein [Bathymodiolus japonicus methanotrophic gill symbiont]
MHQHCVFQLLNNWETSVVYTPATNFTGDDNFIYKVSDGKLGSGDVTVTITVTLVNAPPVALADAYSVHEDTGISIDAAHGLLHNDSDPEHNQLTVSLVSNVSNGTLQINKDGSFDYTPATNYNGLDSFSYKANDAQLDSNTVTVR